MRRGAATSRRCRDHVDGRADRGALPDVAPARPLAPAVDADDLRLDDAIVLEVRGELRQRPVPEDVFLAVPAERQPDLVDRVAGPHQDLRLRERLLARLLGAERDPAGEHVALRGHQRERALVGVEDHDAGRELHPAGQRHAQQRDVAGRDSRQRPVEAVARRPELGKARLPRRDQLFRRDARRWQPHRVGLLPHLAEALDRRCQPAAVDVDVRGAVGDVADPQRGDRLRPAVRVAPSLVGHPAHPLPAATASAAASVSWIPTASSSRVSSKIWR